MPKKTITAAARAKNKLPSEAEAAIAAKADRCSEIAVGQPKSYFEQGSVLAPFSDRRDETIFGLISFGEMVEIQ